MVVLGVPSRREAPLYREEAKNHAVRGYEEEFLQKGGKDAAYGAALLIKTE